MTPMTFLTEILFAAVSLLGALLLVRIGRRRRRSPEEIERLRRLEIHRRGRLAAGVIVNFVEPAPGKRGPRMVVYKYEVGGVTYEAAQDIAALPSVVSLARRALAQMTGLKYDPHRPANSIIACEEWCGVPNLNGRTLVKNHSVQAREANVGKF